MEGGDLYRRQPHIYKFAYLARLYDPVSRHSLESWLSGAGFSCNSYTHFLEDGANGLKFSNLNLYGLVELVDRSVGPSAGQPISIDYGNVIERPGGLAKDQMVIGGTTGWSSRGVYIIDSDGRVRLTHYTDADDVAAEWGSLEAMLKSETGRIARLLDGTGEPISTHTSLMHPEGRRWETEVEPMSSFH